MTGHSVSRQLMGAVLGCAASAVFAAVLLAAPLALRGDVVGMLLYACLFYIFSFFAAVALGIPVFLLAFRFGAANVWSAAAFGGLVGGSLGFWIGNWQSGAVVPYAGVGVLCGVVFHFVQSRYALK